MLDTSREIFISPSNRLDPDELHLDRRNVSEGGKYNFYRFEKFWRMKTQQISSNWNFLVFVWGNSGHADNSSPRESSWTSNLSFCFILTLPLVTFLFGWVGHCWRDEEWSERWIFLMHRATKFVLRHLRTSSTLLGRIYGPRNINGNFNHPPSATDSMTRK